MDFAIRLATAADAEALCRMNTAFNGDTGVTADDVRASLRHSPEVVVVAHAGDSPAGFCCAQVHRSFCYTAPAAEVTEMYVEPDFRRMGCAVAMLRFLEAHLRSEYGVDEMHLLTGCSNLAAQAAYRKAGFLPHPEVYLSRRL